MKILGLICARGGSKGIPGKNIKEFGGKPMIAHAIEVAKQSSYIQDIVVSTDDQQIADIAKEYGAEVPFLRPDHLASDKALQIDAICHVLEELKKQGRAYDALVLLQPTSPLRAFEDVDGAIKLFVDKAADSVVTVTNANSHHPMILYRKEGDHSLDPFVEADSQGVLRQDFKDVWRRNGAVYVMKTELPLNHKTLYGDKIYGYEMPEARSINIDEPLDLVIAEALLAYNQRQDV